MITFGLGIYTWQLLVALSFTLTVRRGGQFTRPVQYTHLFPTSRRGKVSAGLELFLMSPLLVILQLYTTVYCQTCINHVSKK